MVVMGVKMIYVPWMPGHRKRLTQTYVDEQKLSPSVQYIVYAHYVQLSKFVTTCYPSLSLSLSLSLTYTHTHSMVQLIKPSADKEYVDLTVSFSSSDDEGEDSPGPPVRYYFK